MALKYTISIGLNKFEVKDGVTAISIAELLVNNFVPGTYNKELTALVEVEKVKDDAEVEAEEEAEDDDES